MQLKEGLTKTKRGGKLSLEGPTEFSIFVPFVLPYLNTYIQTSALLDILAWRERRLSVSGQLWSSLAAFN